MRIKKRYMCGFYCSVLLHASQKKPPKPFCFTLTSTYSLILINCLLYCPLINKILYVFYLRTFSSVYEKRGIVWSMVITCICKNVTMTVKYM